MKVASHLRECHGYSLAESVKWAPRTMAEVHDREHVETECDHTHDDGRAASGAHTND